MYAAFTKFISPNEALFTGLLIIGTDKKKENEGVREKEGEREK